MNKPILSLSTEASYLKRSVMRDLLSLATAPDILSLAGGLPASEFLPLQQYQQCLNDVLNREGSRAMQYSPQSAPLREWIAGYMRARGVDCDESQVFLTNGAQQGLTILSRLLLDPGETAVIEAATFTGIQQITAGRGARVLTVPTDLQTGVDLDALEAAFSQRPRFAVIIPDFHNPLGVSLSAEKRQRIAELAARYAVPVIEDDPYSALRFEGDQLPPIKAYDEAGYVFYLGSFSKMLAPSARLGWIVAPSELIPKIVVMRESIDLESSILTQQAVYEFVSHGLLEAHLTNFNRENRQRRDALLSALDEHVGGIASWTQPQGGLFVWVTLPEGVDTWAMFEQAVAEKVIYIPGAAFTIDGTQRNAMRLNFSNTRPELLREAVRRLADVIHTQFAFER
ncbi:MAG: PLP-dependent aminotransferase family protein [Anaerolinea sp.]|nr:PLP-dependent aminotransferase family protein [Anaerolinea sp.]